MTAKKIETEEDLKAALTRLEKIMLKNDKSDLDEMIALENRIEAFENLKFPIRKATAVAVIRHQMKQFKMTQRALSQETGIGQNNLSEILNGKRKLNATHIEKLHQALHIPLAILHEIKDDGRGNRRANRQSKDIAAAAPAMAAKKMVSR